MRRQLVRLISRKMLRISYLIRVRIVYGGLISYAVNYSHFLVRLIGLECVVIGIYVGMSGVLRIVGQEVISRLYFLVIGVREGGLGLALLVLVRYRCGRDRFKSCTGLVC